MQTLALFVVAVISTLTIVEALQCQTCFTVDDDGLAANLTEMKDFGKNSKDCKTASDSLQDVKDGEYACGTATGTLTTGQTFLIRAGMKGPRENKCEDGENGKKVMDYVLDTQEGQSEAEYFHDNIKEVKVCFTSSAMTLTLNSVFMIFALIGLTPSFFGLW